MGHTISFEELFRTGGDDGPLSASQYTNMRAAGFEPDDVPNRKILNIYKRWIFADPDSPIQPQQVLWFARRGLDITKVDLTDETFDAARRAITKWLLDEDEDQVFTAESKRRFQSKNHDQ